MLMQVDKERMLGRLQVMLGTDESKDKLLGYLLEDAANAVRRDCRLPDGVLPDGLEGIICRIAADFYRTQGYGQAEREAPITSYTEGPRSWSYAVDKRTAAEIVGGYSAELAPYRRMGW